MKSYNKRNSFLEAFFSVSGIVCSLDLYFSDVFPWLEKIDMILLLLVFVMVLFTPAKYYCGIVTLQISSNVIERRWLGIRTTTLPCANAYVQERHLFGIRLMVFSTYDARKYGMLRIMKDAALRKLIIFPYQFQLKQDFPALFEDP